MARKGAEVRIVACFRGRLEMNRGRVVGIDQTGESEDFRDLGNVALGERAGIGQAPVGEVGNLPEGSGGSQHPVVWNQVVVFKCQGKQLACLGVEFLLGKLESGGGLKLDGAARGAFFIGRWQNPKGGSDRLAGQGFGDGPLAGEISERRAQPVQGEVKILTDQSR